MGAWEWITEHATVLSAVMSAIATGFIAWFTIRLAKVSHLQARLTREAIKDAKRSSERQLRAYVLVDHIELRPGLGAVAQIRNFGKSPAYNVKISFESQWKDRNDSIAVLPLTEKRYTHPGTTIPPGHPINFQIDFGGVPLTKDPRDWGIFMQDGKGGSSLRPFAWGRIDYVDAFKKSRWSVFQFFSDLDGPTLMSQCAEGNDADQEEG